MRPVRVYKEDMLRYVEDRKVVRIAEVMSYFGCSASTFFRKLRGIDYITSYNENGRFMTLLDVPSFDDNGLWEFEEACFSVHGGVRPTVEYIVNGSERGLSAGEINDILKTRVNNQLRLCIKEGRIVKKRYGQYQIYFSSAGSIQKSQMRKRDELFSHGINKERGFVESELFDIEKVHFGYLAQLILSDSLSADDLYTMLNGMGKSIQQREEVREVILRYNLDVKKTQLQLRTKRKCSVRSVVEGLKLDTVTDE